MRPLVQTDPIGVAEHGLRPSPPGEKRLRDGRDRQAPLERFGVAERGSSKSAEMTEETAGAPLKQLSEDPARPAGATLLT